MPKRGSDLNASEQIISKQIEWAKNKGLQLFGSAGNRGRRVYTKSIADNLFKSLSDKSRKELEGGDGGELNGNASQPAKIQALHSSSALGINLFDYWREQSDSSLLFAACGLSRAGNKLTGEIQFEQKFTIDDRFQYSPNLDVIFVHSQPHKFKVFAIECKFTEPYSSRGHSGLDPKYFSNGDIWHNLSATKHLGQEISPEDSHFKYLRAAQLIKHILGLNRKFGHSRYRLLYLWYDALGEPGFKHRQEVDEFADVVRSDGVVFHNTTYQDLIVGLARHRNKHEEYVKYLTDRYL